MSSEISVLETHEQRIQGVETAVRDFSSHFAAHAAADKVQFERISDQIGQVGKEMTTAIGDLTKKVETLGGKTEKHHESLKKLFEERADRARRKRAIKRIVVAGLLALVGAFWDTFFADGWKWVRHFFH